MQYIKSKYGIAAQYRIIFSVNEVVWSQMVTITIIMLLI